MIELDGPWFIDKETGRTIFFHGINVSGGAKLPIGIPSHTREGYWIDYDRKVNFVGRPFPLEEADLHLERLKQFGFNLLRFVITWEAIEHEGPGIYDFEYINYVIQILLKCRKYDLKVFIDPHQDTWSRHCGGSGHPGWTLSLAGFHPLRFEATIAALVQNTYGDPESFPKMIWNTNYDRLAAQTMFTLFFAGKTFAPNCIINDMNIQDYLQQRFFNAIVQLIKKLIEHDLQDDIVIGYDTMNEPGKGYLEFADLTQLDNSDTSFKMGLMPTPFQAMLLGSGIPTKVAHYKFIWSGPKKTGDILVNPNGEEETENKITAWLTKDELRKVDEIFGWKRGDQWKKNESGCIWELHKVWDKSTQTLLCPHYFANDPSHENKPTQFAEHYWIPFINDYIQTIRTYHQKAIIFVQPPIIDKPPKLPSDNIHFQRLVYTPHWYDGLTLVKKKWCSYNIDFINLNRGKYGSSPLRFIRAMCFGEKSIRNCFIKQIKTIREEGLEQIGPYPCLLGEIGIPYDMEKKKDDNKYNQVFSSSSSSSLWQYITLCFGSFFSSFYNNKNNAIYLKNNNVILDPDSSQNKAMDASINAVENNLINYTLWHYVPDNNSRWGDRWNGEDLSIWQQEEEELIDTKDTTILNKKNHLEEDIKSFSESVTLNTSTEEINKPYILSSSINQRQIVCLYRPHPKVTAGIPTFISYESPTTKKDAFYTYEFKARTNIKNKVTEIYIPCKVFPPPFSPSILDNHVTQYNNHSGTQVNISIGSEWKANEINKEYWILHWWWNDDQLLKENDFKMKLEMKGKKWN